MAVEYVGDALEAYFRYFRLQRELVAYADAWHELSGTAASTDRAAETVFELTAEGRLADAARTSKRLHEAAPSSLSLVSVAAMQQSCLGRQRRAKQAAVAAGSALQDAISVSQGLASWRDEWSSFLETRSGQPVDLPAQVRDADDPWADGRSRQQREFIRSHAAVRLNAVHAHLVLLTAKRAPFDTVPEQVFTDCRTSVEGTTRRALHRLRSLASNVDDGSRLGWPFELMALAETTEAGLRDQLETVAGCLRAVEREYRAQSSRTFSMARDAAAAYDAFREGLAALAAVHDLALAWCFDDGKELKAWRQAAELPLTDPADLPRTRASSIRSGAVDEGTRVELAGLATSVRSELSPIRNRTFIDLSVDGEASATVVVYVPHAAIDSFGIGEGTWCQVRGTYFPDGKDAVSAPTLMLERERLADASEVSFRRFVHHRGRTTFPYSRQGWAIKAGRRGGSRAAANEVVFWSHHDAVGGAR